MAQKGVLTIGTEVCDGGYLPGHRGAGLLAIGVEGAQIRALTCKMLNDHNPLNNLFALTLSIYFKLFTDSKILLHKLQSQG